MSKKQWWKRQRQQQAQQQPVAPQPVPLLLAEQMAIESIIRGRAELDAKEKQIIADIAGLRQMTPEQLTGQYLITPQGLIPQVNAQPPQPPMPPEDDGSSVSAPAEQSAPN